MKLISILLLVIFNSQVMSMSPPKDQIISIEALSYLDNTPVKVDISNGKIIAITRIKELSGENKGIYVAPGFIDNQVNGFMGVSFVFGGGDLTPDGVKKVTRALWEVGVTTYLPTLTTNDQQALIRSFSILAKVKDDPDIKGSIAGYHLEGPYISPIDGYRGAHPLKHVRKPDWAGFMELYNASGKGIIQVTLAPEVEGGMEFIDKCRENNILVALGHHNSNMAQVTEAIDKGARIATHLGNGCANTINRHSNPLWPQLSDDRLMASIICDGFHLRPEQIRVFVKAKGIENIVITSDVTSFGGLPSGKYQNEDGETIELTQEGNLIYPAQNVLYGSASPVVRGIGHVMKVTGCSLGDAVTMVSTNPAKLYGLDDRGELKVGKRADLVLFSVDDYKVQVQKTIVAGEVVYEVKK